MCVNVSVCGWGGRSNNINANERLWETARKPSTGSTGSHGEKPRDLVSALHAAAAAFSGIRKQTLPASLLTRLAVKGAGRRGLFRALFVLP